MFWSAVAAGPISGQFYMEKSTFAAGEPIFLYFEVANEGPSPEKVPSADPYSFCSGYEVSVSRDPDVKPSCAPLGGYADPAIHDSRATEDTLEVRETFYFRVTESTYDPHAFQPWVDQLRSPDLLKRREAARTLASVAPRSLEDTLLAFANDQEIRSFAPLAFQRLNTPRSMATMAQLLKTSEPGTFEHMKSADYLAESDDQQWFPLLFEVARKNARISNYIDDAVKLGGDKMLPTLVSLMNSPDKEFTRINAVTAMGSTGSRAAVPILLDLLRSPKPVADRARYSLRMLTHHTANDKQSESPQSEYLKWSQWWTHEGATAPIYKATNCGDLSPLK
jgi:hypothetical protein